MAGSSKKSKIKIIHDDKSSILAFHLFSFLFFCFVNIDSLVVEAGVSHHATGAVEGEHNAHRDEQNQHHDQEERSHSLTFYAKQQDFFCLGMYFISTKYLVK